MTEICDIGDHLESETVKEFFTFRPHRGSMENSTRLLSILAVAIVLALSLACLIWLLGYSTYWIVATYIIGGQIGFFGGAVLIVAVTE